VERFEVAGVSEVLVGRGLLDAAVLLSERPGRASVAVLAQPSVAKLGRRLVQEIRRAGVAAEVRILPDGEAAKTMAVVEDVYQWLTSVDFKRGDTVIGVGGGALTDVAGFVAATYLRGVESVYVPTTLLGAVDAAIGGKTAVNLEAKNIVGAFHHPARVVVDADVLDLLPPELRREGSAEAVKAGLIGDPKIVDLYERDGLDADLEEIVRRAMAVKAAIVTRDPTEHGERALLNYGHTVGHAVEMAAGLSHGSAVAVGMVAAGRASSLALGFADEERQRRVIASLGLPVAAPEANAAEVHRLLAMDKKRDAEGLRMVLLAAIGEPQVEHVDSATVEQALGIIGI